jgi:hypothetical protein
MVEQAKAIIETAMAREGWHRAPGGVGDDGELVFSREPGIGPSILVGVHYEEDWRRPAPAVRSGARPALRPLQAGRAREQAAWGPPKAGHQGPTGRPPWVNLWVKAALWPV